MTFMSLMMLKVRECLITRKLCDLGTCVTTEGVAQNRNVIMHLLSQVRIGMDLSRVSMLFTIGTF